MRLLFSHRKTFAVGHGCAAEWNDPTGSTTTGIRTESLPSYEIEPIIPRQIGNLDLAMQDLSEMSGGAVILCRRLADEYSRWIDDREDEVPRLNAEYRQAAQRHLQNCRNALERMRAGIALLETDNLVRRAFALMNQAMLAQQFHYRLASDPSKQRKWIRQGESLVVATEFNSFRVGNLPVSFNFAAPAKFNWTHLCATPRTVQHDKRIFPFAFKKVLKFLNCISVPDGSHITANPKPD